MTNREFAKMFLWDVMIKPIPKLIAVWWATTISTLGVSFVIAYFIKKLSKNKK